MRKMTLTLLCLLSLAACGKNGKDGKDGVDGARVEGLNGADGISTGIDFADIDPGLVCPTGGVSIFTFRDENSDSILQSEEPIIKVKAICNGLNGLDGQDGADGQDGVDGTNASLTLESIAASTTCPNGGVRISSNTSPAVEVCNGINGLNGEQGIPGVQGIPGMTGATGAAGADGQDGAPGTSILPVKFCATDNSTFPEYGLMIGEDLFAVYWGTTPASPSKPQAFLTKLVPGRYQSTGGNNCLFTIQ